MALQPAAQELNPLVLAVVAMLAWQSPPLLPSVSAKEAVRAVVRVRDKWCPR